MKWQLNLILVLFFVIPLATASIEISNVIDTFEFDTTNGMTPTSVIVSESASSSIVAIFYEGTQSDGFVTTIEISHDGSIIQSNIDTFEFDTTQGIEPSALKISDTTFAVVYRGAQGDGFAQTIEILNNGSIVGTIETLEVDDSDLNHANIFFIQESRNFIGVTSAQTSVNGVLGLGFILDNGTINRTDRFVFNDTQANNVDSINVSNNIVLVVYHADIGGDNFGGALETIAVLDNGSVTDTLDYQILDAGQGDSPAIARIDDNTFAIFYEGVGTNGIVKTFDIDPTTGIISSVIESFTYDSGDGQLPNAIPIGGNIILNVYEDASTQGQLIALEISDTGIINNTIIANLTFEDTLSTWQEIINIKDDLFLITYQGVGLDGFIKTVNISTVTIADIDSTNPVMQFINIEQGLNLSTIDKMATPIINVTAFCFDDNAHNFSISFYNSSEVLFNFTNSTLLPSINLSIIEFINLTPIGLGDYDSDAICFDNSSNLVSVHFDITINDFSDPILISPENNTLVSFLLGDDVDFVFSINTDASCDLLVNDTVVTSKVVSPNSPTIKSSFIENQTIKWQINCSTIPAGVTATSEFHVLEIKVVPLPVDAFVVGQCDLNSLPKVALLIFFFIVAFIAMAIAKIFRIGIVGFFGGFMLVGLSVYIWACIAFVAIMIATIGLLLMFFFIVKGVNDEL